MGSLCRSPLSSAIVSGEIDPYPSAAQLRWKRVASYLNHRNDHCQTTDRPSGEFDIVNTNRP